MTSKKNKIVLSLALETDTRTTRQRLNMNEWKQIKFSTATYRNDEEQK